MIKALFLLQLLFLVSCATKYVLPGNRFISPESQGGFGESQFEFQQTTATVVQPDLTGGSVNNPVVYSESTRTGYLLSSSLLDSVDFFWSHTASSVSILGLKLQFIGSSRTAKGAGNKLALTAGIGGNEHEIEAERKVEFTLNGNDFSLIHGYRFTENVMIYDAISYSTFTYDGKIKASDFTHGLEPHYKSKLVGFYVGVELTYAFLLTKVEYGYQSISSTHSKKLNNNLLGVSFGISW